MVVLPFCVKVLLNFFQKIADTADTKAEPLNKTKYYFYIDFNKIKIYT